MTENGKDVLIGGGGVFTAITLANVSQTASALTALLSFGLICFRWYREVKKTKDE